MKISKLIYTLLIILISLIIVCFSASAEGEVAKIGDTLYATFADAITAANGMGEDAAITLLSDITVSQTYTISNNITINGDNHTITRGNTYTGILFTVNSGKSFTINELTIDGNNEWVLNETLINESLYYTSDNKISDFTSFYTFEPGAPLAINNIIYVNGGKLTLNNSTIQNNAANPAVITGKGAVVSGVNKAIITFNNSAVKHCLVTNNANVVGVHVNNSEFIMNDGSELSDNFGVTNAVAVGVYSAAKFTMNGGEIKNNYDVGGNGTAVFIHNGTVSGPASEFIMNGGRISGNLGVNATSGLTIYLHTNARMIMNGGEIVGNAGRRSAVSGNKDTSSIEVYGGYFNNLSVLGEADIRAGSGKVLLFGGEYASDVSEFCAEGFTLCAIDTDDDGEPDTYKVVKLINIELEDITPDGAEAEKLYNINLTTTADDALNKIKSVDLTFAFSKDADMGYEIIQSNPEFDVNSVDNITPRYSFLYNAGSSISASVGEKINIGQVRFTGHGTFSFAVDTLADTNKVLTAEAEETVNGVIIPAITEFIPEHEDGKGYLNITYNTIEEFIPIPKRKLIVNIDFNNAIEIKTAANQLMKFKLGGGMVSKIFSLGNENIDESTDALIEYPVKITVTEKGYKAEVDLPYNTIYTVILEGAGYRTARYSVNLSENKTLNFWNNIKKDPKEVEEGLASSKTTHNFLIGDIIKDDKINIYDLSAVLSYFGAKNISESNNPDYIKYDLNRDGIIDSKDVAYILIGWGK